jgi:hypothetical protein
MEDESLDEDEKTQSHAAKAVRDFKSIAKKLIKKKFNRRSYIISDSASKLRDLLHKHYFQDLDLTFNCPNNLELIEILKKQAVRVYFTNNIYQISETLTYFE